MGPLGFTRHSLWLLVLDAGERPTPILQRIDHVPSDPADGELDRLMSMCDRLLDGRCTSRTTDSSAP